VNKLITDKHQLVDVDEFKYSYDPKIKMQILTLAPAQELCGDALEKLKKHTVSQLIVSKNWTYKVLFIYTIYKKKDFFDGLIYSLYILNSIR